jgi:hypothetical protein
MTEGISSCGSYSSGEAFVPESLERLGRGPAPSGRGADSRCLPHFRALPRQGKDWVLQPSRCNGGGGLGGVAAFGKIGPRYSTRTLTCT